MRGRSYLDELLQVMKGLTNLYLDGELSETTRSARPKSLPCPDACWRTWSRSSRVLSMTTVEAGQTPESLGGVVRNDQARYRGRPEAGPSASWCTLGRRKLGRISDRGTDDVVQRKNALGDASGGDKIVLHVTAHSTLDRRRF